MTEQAGPTPGPWQWKDGGGQYLQGTRRRAARVLPGVVFARELVSGHQWVMETGADFGSGPFDLVIATREDASLIAAAPDLLAASRRALHHFEAQGEGDLSIAEELRAAIAKAEEVQP